MGSKELSSGIKRKHVALTINDKLKVIEQLESGVPGKELPKNLVLANRLCQILINKKNL
jgi:hypothetical protein